MDLELAGKTFLITGGTDGLGLALARQLAVEGASVAVAPGSISVTRTCRAVTSWRSDSLKAPTPCLVAL